MPFASGNCCQKGCSELWAMLVSRKRRDRAQLGVAVAGYIVSSEFMARKRRGRPVFIMVHLQTVETESYT